MKWRKILSVLSLYICINVTTMVKSTTALKVASFDMDRGYRAVKNWITFDAGTALETTYLGMCFRFMPRYSTTIAIFRAMELSIYVNRFVANDAFGFINVGPSEYRHSR